MQRSELDKLISNQNSGGGVIDSILNPFTAEIYAGERHAYSLATINIWETNEFYGSKK